MRIVEEDKENGRDDGAQWEKRIRKKKQGKKRMKMATWERRDKRKIEKINKWSFQKTLCGGEQIWNLLT